MRIARIFALAMAVTLIGRAETLERYPAIPGRNVFALRAPPEPKGDVSVIVPQPELELSGITTMLGDRRICLRIIEPATARGPRLDRYLLLAEGESAGGVSVVSVDSQAGHVTVRQNGKLRELTFPVEGKTSNAQPSTRIPPVHSTLRVER